MKNKFAKIWDAIFGTSIFLLSSIVLLSVLAKLSVSYPSVFGSIIWFLTIVFLGGYLLARFFATRQRLIVVKVIFVFLFILIPLGFYIANVNSNEALFAMTFFFPLWLPILTPLFIGYFYTVRKIYRWFVAKYKVEIQV